MRPGANIDLLEHPLPDGAGEIGELVFEGLERTARLAQVSFFEEISPNRRARTASRVQR